MIDASALLKDLQAELGRLVSDLEARVTEDDTAPAGLEGEWRTAFAAKRTGRTFAEWREDRLTQVAVAWLLAGVFIRFGEDNGLIDEARLSGPGERGGAARDAHQRFFVAHPHSNDREYLHDVFREAATLRGLAGVVGAGESPLWLVDPPADAATRLLALFRATDAGGALVHDFIDPALGTRFLGDLYQDLSEHAKSTYALLQTPEFVEEFILDRTLTPAIETFGLANTTAIDCTAGSGHFLLGAFGRLFQAWRAAEPGESVRVHAERALAAVTGVDLNPFAAAIARFRLLVAALQACGETRLADAPDFAIDVAVGDSLLWGAKPGQLAGMEEASATAERQFLYVTEHADALRRIFNRRYSVVVGNPPYIVCRDPALNAQYRDRYESCHRQYSLGVPFTEKFFDLATEADHLGRPAGFVGLITANSFMKREFGKKLIEDKRFFRSWDLTHVIDTSGAYIPGHGTPTVILFGRHQAPVAATVRTVMGIRGEPSTPPDPASGLVWTAITAQVDEPGSDGAFVSAADVDRARFGRHPWSIGGGGAAELKEQLDQVASSVLVDHIGSIGSLVYTRCDDAYLSAAGCPARSGISAQFVQVSIEGESIRDFRTTSPTEALFPYNAELRPTGEPALLRRLWPYYRDLIARREINGSQLEIGLEWYEYNRFLRERFQIPLSIAFAFVSTHNHFILDRGGKMFTQSATVIKLAENASIDDHLALLGPLDSSVACFWMQQVFHNNGRPGAESAAADEGWEFRYQHDGTKLKQFPIAAGPAPVELARKLDGLAFELSVSSPKAAIAAAGATRTTLDEASATAASFFAQMVAAQEELDWTCLQLYGLTDEALMVPDGREAPPLQLGERAFEIVLARQVECGEAETAWFTRHRSTPITELPTHWPGWYSELVQRRIDLIGSDRDVALVERPEHKRRWAREPLEKQEERALRSWLQDRLESRQLWFDGTGDSETARCRSVAQLADKVVATDPEFLDVARLWRGMVEVDPVQVVTDLLAEEHVPAQSGARYKAKGFDKRRQWERTWEMQRAEDLGEPLPDGLDRIPVPPKYGSGDFAKVSYWKQRGKLDVPKERFTSVACAEREADPTLVLAWAGFDAAELSQAIGSLLIGRQQSDGWDTDRCWPLVVAMAEQLFWLDQWHHEVDPRWGDSPATLYRQIVEEQARHGDRTLADVPAWRAPAATRGRKKKDTP